MKTPWIAILLIAAFNFGPFEAKGAQPRVGQTLAGQPLCGPGFRQLGTRNKERANPVLDALYEAIHKYSLEQANPDLRHTMKVVNGQGQLSIGYLSSSVDPVFLERVADAVRAGAISEINVGNIVGPKVLNWIVRTSELAPAGHVMKMNGHFKLSSLFHQQAIQMLDEKLATGEGRKTASAFKWGPEQVERMNEAIRRLGLDRACKKLWKTSDLRKCHQMRFELDSSNLEATEWRRD